MSIICEQSGCYRHVAAVPLTEHCDKLYPRLHICAVCATCYNTACPVKHLLPLYADIDCGALFRVLDQQGFVCEYQSTPEGARV